ncbi:MAG: hypothetical protein RR902_06030 [Oscillospiraceae bacterium]
MTTSQIVNLGEFTQEVTGEDKEINGFFCCDLLSHVMGQSLEGNVWCTVMANINSLAVASLSDAACLILCHGIPLTDEMRAKATQQGINVFTTNLAEFTAAIKIAKSAGLV